MAEARSFGVFFRMTRKGLGVTLRAFCRQNRFDAGNVSRVERGLVPPPKKEEGLERYAKALKLRKGSESYNQFFDLAAKETGRIPPALLEAHAEKLPRLLRQLRSGPGHRNWVTARHLNQWADSLAARSVLPQLIRRLTRATGNAVTFVSFPALDQTQRTGPDGGVDAAEHDAFVPLGRSVWEMGVSKKPGEKAEGDFAKRRKEKLGFDKKRATFIFVTPQNWPAKQKWVDAKNELKVWKEVRVYDSANLEEWLELAPAVDVWLARQLEVRPEGLSDIDEYWDNLAGVTDPPLKPSVFLASRKKQVEDIVTWLKGPPGIVALESRSPAEAVDFVAAVVRQMTEREVVTARTVVVHEKNAWRSIARSGAKLVLLAHPDLVLDQETVAEAVRLGHHVVLPVGQAVTDRVFTLPLPRVYRHHLEEALRESGMDRTEASNYAGKVGGSLTVLKRLLAKVRGTRAPAWCSTSEGTPLVPMLLAGAWEDQVEGDRVALASLSGQSYDVVAEVAARWLDIPDPPLKRILSHWSLVSRDDSWFLLAHTILLARLKQFEKVALEVLGENDPAFDLPPEGRWMANIQGKVLCHSRSLRTGVAETLALLGARSDRLPSSADAPGMAAEVVRRLLEPKDWKRWASLSHDLPLLAEAAPDAFLTAVENDLRSKKPVLPKLFEQDGPSLIFSSYPHAGLLWALEGLAWNRGELPRVSYALARLDELLAGKKSGNSPMTSLVEIYLPWFPQTTAPVDERVAILRNICERHADTGWRLLLKLLPDQMGHSSDIRRPAYRDWGLTWKDKGPSTADYNRQVRECSALTVEVAGQDSARLKDLIEHFENLAVPAGENLLLRLRSLDVATVANADRRQLAEALRDKIVEHRRFKDADWAMPEEVLARLETVQRHLEPRDAVSRNAWLFNQIWEVIAHDEGTAEAEVMNDREQAIREVIAELGWDGVLALAAVVKAPDELGVAVGRTGSATDDGKVLPTLLESKEQSLLKFARGYVAGRFSAGGWEWAEKLKKRWRNEACLAHVWHGSARDLRPGRAEPWPSLC
jgi:transcriptional regulator with XRE-family HTH domain